MAASRSCLSMASGMRSVMAVMTPILVARVASCLPLSLSGVGDTAPSGRVGPLVAWMRSSLPGSAGRARPRRRRPVRHRTRLLERSDSLPGRAVLAHQGIPSGHCSIVAGQSQRHSPRVGAACVRSGRRGGAAAPARRSQRNTRGGTVASVEVSLKEMMAACRGVIGGSGRRLHQRDGAGHVGRQ